MRSVLSVVVTLVMAAVLSGCGSSAPTPEEPRLPPSSQIELGLNEWGIITAGAVALPGEVELTITNTGGAAHDLVVSGVHGEWVTPVLSTGDQTTLTITAEPGEVLELVCTLPGHARQGMTGALAVAASPG